MKTIPQKIYILLQLIFVLELDLKHSCFSTGRIATTDLQKVLLHLELDGALDEGNVMDNLIKSADPNNKGSVSFEKYVMLVQINSKSEDETEIIDPEGNQYNKSFYPE